MVGKTASQIVTHKELSMLVEIHAEAKESIYVSSGPGMGKSEVVKQTAKKIANKLNKNFVEWNKLTDKEKHNLLNDGQQQTPKVFTQAANPFAKPIGQQQVLPLQLTSTISDKYIFADIRLSQKDSTDIGGMPSTINDENITKWCPPLLMKVLARPEAHGMILLDELPNASMLTQNAAYSLVLDRAAGELTFADGISVVGAGNRLSDKSNIFDRPMALKNRFGNYELKPPSADSWIKDFAIPAGLDSRMIGFVNNKPDILCMEIDKVNEESFPTPRSITSAARIINGITDHHIVKLIISGWCGSGMGAEFDAWLQLGSKLDIDAILADPVNNCPTEQGQRWFMLAGIKERVVQHIKNNNKKIVVNYAKLLDQIDPDLQVSSLYQVKKSVPTITSILNQYPEGIKVGARLDALLLGD